MFQSWLSSTSRNEELHLICFLRSRSGVLRHCHRCTTIWRSLDDIQCQFGVLSLFFSRLAADAVFSLFFAAAVVVAVVVCRPRVVWCNCSGGIGRLVCAYVVKCSVLLLFVSLCLSVTAHSHVLVFPVVLLLTARSDSYEFFDDHTFTFCVTRSCTFSKFVVLENPAEIGRDDCLSLGSYQICFSLLMKILWSGNPYLV